MDEIMHKALNLERVFNKPLTVRLKITFTTDERRQFARLYDKNLKSVTRQWLAGWLRTRIQHGLDAINKGKLP